MLDRSFEGLLRFAMPLFLVMPLLGRCPGRNSDRHLGRSARLLRLRLRWCGRMRRQESPQDRSGAGARSATRKAASWTVKMSVNIDVWRRGTLLYIACNPPRRAFPTPSQRKDEHGRGESNLTDPAVSAQDLPADPAENRMRSHDDERFLQELAGSRIGSFESEHYVHKLEGVTRGRSRRSSQMRRPPHPAPVRAGGSTSVAGPRR